jgi:hypothetical protein
MRQLSFRLVQLWRDYCAEFKRALDHMAAYGRNAPSTAMQESVAKFPLISVSIRAPSGSGDQER